MTKVKVRDLVKRSKINKSLRTKIVAWVPVVAFVLSVTGANIIPNIAGAYGQVLSRSIKMSSSAVSASSVKYTVTFNTATTGNIQGVVVDFCSSSPLPGTACTAPTGFTVGNTLTAANTGLNPTAAATWTQTSVNTGRTFEMTYGSGASVSSGSTITFEILSNTNPSTTGTFYARIFTFATVANVTTWNGTADGSATANVVDAGGIALSTVAQITITSKVQESITFCVYTSAYDAGACTGTGNSVALGNANGVLSTAGSYTDITTKYDIQTNALNNLTIRMTGTTLTSGSNSIYSTLNVSGTGAASTTGYSSTAGSPQFGLCTWEPTGTTITPATTYDSTTSGGGACSGVTTGYNLATTAKFGYNLVPASGIPSTYGDTLATVTPGATAEGQIAFLGNISNTTPAGIYQATLTFIATGSY